MGWLWFAKPDNVKARLDQACTWDRPESKGRVLKSALVSMSEYYAAVELTRPDGERYVFAAVFMVKFAKSDGVMEMGYKDMDESCGPCNNRCPEQILDLLTDGEHVNEYARRWREKCREYHAQRKDRTEQEWMQEYDPSIIAAWKSGLRVRIGFYNEGFIRSVPHTHQFWIVKVKNGRRGWSVTVRDKVQAVKVGKNWVDVVDTVAL
jgi:hypothetical protein